MLLQIPVPPELLDEVEAQYAPPNHPVFQLAPQAFDQRAHDLYADIGEPVVSSDTFWDIYRQLLQRFHESESDHELLPIITAHSEDMQTLEEENAQMDLLPNMKPFRNGNNIVGPCGHKYIGGLVNPPAHGLRGSFSLEEYQDSEDLAPDVTPEYAYFTTEDESDGEGGSK